MSSAPGMKKFEVQLATTVRVRCHYQGKEEIKEVLKASVEVGRFHDNVQPDLDLFPDINVSRKHARISVDAGTYWIEDLGSKFGTKVDGEEIKGQGKKQLKPGNSVQMGDTLLHIDVPSEQQEFFTLLPPSQAATADVKIGETMDASVSAFNLAKTASVEVMQRQALLLELPLQFGSQTRLDTLLQTIVQHVVDAIPGAERGTLLLRSRHNDALLLTAFISPDEPAVSETLARRAISEGKGFLWRRSFEGDVGVSIQRHRIESGMYAPLMWKGKALGVICVDNPYRDSAFTDDDLRLIMAIANYAAIAVANHQLQDDLRHNATLLERLLTNFSPRIRESLIEKARHGRLRPGGVKSEVSILFSDIRGFTAKTRDMDAGDVVEMLNDYLPALAKAIFRYDGTIDKFIGDAVLAVFGSPEPDPLHQEKAVRAALAMQMAMREVNEKRGSRGEVVAEIGIGVHCGEVLHGFIGAAERLDFTVIGDAVNRASRFCSAAKAGEILISQEIYQRVFKIIQAEKTSIKTKHEGDINAYRVKLLTDQTSEPALSTTT